MKKRFLRVDYERIAEYVLDRSLTTDGLLVDMPSNVIDLYLTHALLARHLKRLETALQPFNRNGEWGSSLEIESEDEDPQLTEVLFSDQGEDIVHTFQVSSRPCAVVHLQGRVVVLPLIKIEVLTRG